MQNCGNNLCDGQHAPMSLIRDEDCYPSAASLGYLLLYLLSPFVTIVWFWCCVLAATVPCALCIPSLRPRPFAIVGPVRCTHLSVRATLCTFVLVMCRILDRVMSK